MEAEMEAVGVVLVVVLHLEHCPLAVERQAKETTVEVHSMMTKILHYVLEVAVEAKLQQDKTHQTLQEVMVAMV
jgi:hypothetical protein